jgi:organic hydroperoxide reductase OsmC/OhrA
MQDLPHHYVASARVEGTDNVIVSGDKLPDLETAGPPEFGGPGNVWSPETLLVAAIADCFVLSFRAIARTAKLDWLALECTVEGELDKVDGFTQFTGFNVHATLTIPNAEDEKKAGVILQKAEKYCLITNSMKAESDLSAEVVVAA